MRIRQFQTGDEEALFDVFFSSIHQIASKDYTAEQVNAWAPVGRDPESWAARMRTLQPFVVEIGGVIVGYADVRSDGYIDHFFVSGGYSRRGVGKMLMERIHEETVRLSIHELTADVSKTAEPFFVRYGFQVVERRFPVRKGVTLQNALMRKVLDTAGGIGLAS